jgi:DNA (cytosine-5)-methyltransferase 1
MKTIKVIELFAGAGGFRLALETAFLNDKKFEFVWFNQFEKGEKRQVAYNCYCQNFNDLNMPLANEDLFTIKSENVPDHNLLVAGFPCQDYSVAKSRLISSGLKGEKGSLFWQIIRILKDKQTPYFLLENVDRLIASPFGQRGKDFSDILMAFSAIGYGIEWRVVKSSDYGDPQNRRRVYIFGYKNNTNVYKKYENISSIDQGFFEKAFRSAKVYPKNMDLFNQNYHTYHTQHATYNLNEINKDEPIMYFNSGYCVNGIVKTFKTIPDQQQAKPLKDLLEKHVADQYYLTQHQIEKMAYLKSKKRIPKTKDDGFSYIYQEGQMAFPDSIDKPARTIITGEGKIDRSTHVINDGKGLRFLTPIEVERINGFPDNWTAHVPLRKRYLIMGRGISINILQRISVILYNEIKDSF